MADTPAAHPFADTAVTTPPTTGWGADTLPAAEPARSRWAALGFAAVLVVGVVLVIAPIAGRLFPAAARGDAMVSAFVPYQDTRVLDAYRSDLTLLQQTRDEVAAAHQQHPQLGRDFPLVEKFVTDYPEINTRVSGLLNQVDGGRSDFADFQALQPISAVPFAVFGLGIVATIAGIWGLARWRGRHKTRWPRGVALLAAAGLVIYPIAAGLTAHAGSAGSLLQRYESLETTTTVQQLQRDFVVLVGAVGQMDTGYVAAASAGHNALPAVRQLRERWQPMSSNFAALVGAMNDNLENYSSLRRANNLSKPFGFGAFGGLGWILIGGGVVVAVGALAGLRGSAQRKDGSDNALA